MAFHEKLGTRLRVCVDPGQAAAAGFPPERREVAAPSSNKQGASCTPAPKAESGGILLTFAGTPTPPKLGPSGDEGDSSDTESLRALLAKERAENLELKRALAAQRSMAWPQAHGGHVLEMEPGEGGGAVSPARRTFSPGFVPGSQAGDSPPQRQVAPDRSAHERESACVPRMLEIDERSSPPRDEGPSGLVVAAQSTSAGPKEAGDLCPTTPTPHGAGVGVPHLRGAVATPAASPSLSERWPRGQLAEMVAAFATEQGLPRSPLGEPDAAQWRQYAAGTGRGTDEAQAGEEAHAGPTNWLASAVPNFSVPEVVGVEGTPDAEAAVIDFVPSPSPRLDAEDRSHDVGQASVNVDGDMQMASMPVFQDVQAPLEGSATQQLVGSAKADSVMRARTNSECVLLGSMQSDADGVTASVTRSPKEKAPTAAASRRAAANSTSPSLQITRASVSKSFLPRNDGPPPRSKRSPLKDVQNTLNAERGHAHDASKPHKRTSGTAHAPAASETPQEHDEQEAEQSVEAPGGGASCIAAPASNLDVHDRRLASPWTVAGSVESLRRSTAWEDASTAPDENAPPVSSVPATPMTASTTSVNCEDEPLAEASAFKSRPLLLCTPAHQQRQPHQTTPSDSHHAIGSAHVESVVFCQNDRYADVQAAGHNQRQSLTSSAGNTSTYMSANSTVLMGTPPQDFDLVEDDGEQRSEGTASPIATPRRLDLSVPDAPAMLQLCDEAPQSPPSAFKAKPKLHSSPRNSAQPHGGDLDPDGGFDDALVFEADVDLSAAKGTRSVQQTVPADCSSKSKGLSDEGPRGSECDTIEDETQAGNAKEEAARVVDQPSPRCVNNP